MTATNILTQLRWRYATQKFDTSKKLNEEQLHLLKEAMRLAPSSYGFQPWKFIQVDDPKVREQIKQAAWGQPKVTEASHLFVFASKKDLTVEDAQHLVEETAQAQGKTVEDLSGMTQMLEGFISNLEPEAAEHWAARQVYIPLGFLLSVAAIYGIDAGPMEGFDKAKVDEILGLEKLGYKSRVMCAVGFRAKDDPAAERAKVRYPQQEVFRVVK